MPLSVASLSELGPDGEGEADALGVMPAGDTTAERDGDAAPW
jgi:hypothetical protein